ncbi:MAG: ion channel [Pseudomonadota bacterium]
MLLAFVINSVVIAITVLIHYEALKLISTIIRRMQQRQRTRIIVGVLGALTAHCVEVWVFAVAYYLMIQSGSFGNLIQNFDGSLLDCVYYSFTTYTSLGLGDIEPLGLIRFLTGLESLTGLVMIGWTASFFYMEMTRDWR